MMKKTKCDLQVKRMNNEFQLLQQPEHRRLLRLKNKRYWYFFPKWEIANEKIRQKRTFTHFSGFFTMDKFLLIFSYSIGICFECTKDE